MQFECSIWNLSRPINLLLIISLGGLISCKCETMCNQEGTINSSSASSSSSSGNAISDPNSFYLSCSDLDPDKVYLLGTLQAGSGGFDALVDLDDPIKFCVGFPDGTSSYTITELGEVIYVDHLAGNVDGAGDILKFTQDSLGGNPSEKGWTYPFSPYKNDTNLGLAANRELFLRHNPDTGLDDIYTSVKSSTNFTVFLNSNEAPYIDMKLVGFDFDPKLIGVAPNSSLLIADSDTAIIHVSPDKLVTSITPPVPAPYTFQAITSKLFIDSVTNHQSAWILIWYNSTAAAYPYGRWTLDLETLVMTDDGSFAPSPEGERPLDLKLNGNGELVQTTVKMVSEGNYNYSVIKRPLLSTNASSTILYSDSDDLDNKIWYLRSVPFVYIENGELVTGQ